jgi:DNA-binding response OmpR family regulator
MDKQNLIRLSELANNLNLLYVEDDKILQTKTKQILEELFASVDCADNGQEGLDEYVQYGIENNRFYDLVITDIQMPVMSGVALSKEIVKINPDQTIIVISAHDDSEYLIEFINIGIMKFIKKPFTFDNLILSLLEILESIHSKKIDFGENTFWESSAQKLTKDGQEVHLSTTEKFLLTLFISNKGQIFSKYDLMNILKDEEDMETISSEDSIKSIIKRLRKKIPEETIKNIYGQGYKLEL